ncbi:MAG: hypothetical protein RLZZ500_726 [Bacteroidota bacterium]
MRKLVLSLLFVMQAVVGFAQNGITGKVVDAKSQRPLVEVVVSVQNTALTEVTNKEGVFTFKAVPVGAQIVLLKTAGYKDQLLSVEVTNGKIVDLGLIVMEEDITAEQQLSLVTITDNDLSDDNGGSESTAGLLQASRDAFQQTAAFNWGQARFRIRGLDNENANTMINGVVMNKLYDGRPQWSNWGGLNDATRNQEFTMGSAPSDYTFGGILGTQEINTRASLYRPGSRISFSGTNTNYSWRAMGTHASGMGKNGWAYVISASRRWAKEGYFEGTDYGANSVFVSVEKRINDKHSLNFTSIYAENTRGKSSPNTQEVINLMGHQYNSYWGWQDGRKRNSRDKDILEPILMLSHYWKFNSKTKLNTNVTYQYGSIGNTRLDYQGANNPDPTYYRNLPSYYLNDPANYVTVGTETTNPLAAAAKNYFLNNSQINWNAMYYANMNSSSEAGRSLYALYEDRTDDKQFTANSILFSDLSDNIRLNGGVTYRNLVSHNFQNMLDLLGGQFFRDVDPFYVGDAQQADLNNPNRVVKEGDKYGYNYKLHADVIEAFTQFKFSYKKVDFYLAQSFSKHEYQRDGLYRNGIYANNSYGKSQKKSFENFGFKGGLTYKITGRQFIDINGAYITKAPNLRNTFSNARINNNITPDLQSERIASADVSYIIRTPKFKTRLTAFASKIQNSTNISFYYGEFTGDDADGNEDAFISEILTGVDRRNIGLEFGAEYQITSTIKATAAATYGQYLYANNPHLRVNDDAQATPTNPYPIVDYGTAFLKNYRQAGMPQSAASLEIEYRDPHFWWVSADINYLSDSYISVSNITRTQNFVTNPSTGLSYDGATSESVAKALKQQKLSDITLVNISGGKSWRIDKTTIGFFASINNAFNFIYKTGGFEQSRKANFADYQTDNAYGSPAFGPKYFYGFGRNYFLNLYVNF